MVTKPPPELEQLKSEFDDWVARHGWSTLGYYFDDSPFDGIHLVKSGNLWKLYWKEPGALYAERRFIHLQDAYRNMQEVVGAMKQHEAGPTFEPVGSEIGFEADGESTEKDAGQDGDLTDVFIFFLGQLFVFLPLLLVCGPLLIVLGYAISTLSP